MRNHFLRAAVATGPAYVTDNLVFHIDAGNTNSYSGSGTTVNSLVGNITNSSYNSNISHSTSDGGYWSFGSTTGTGIEFDSITSFMPLGTSDMTYEIWLYKNNLVNTSMSAFGLIRILSNGTTTRSFAHLYFYNYYIGDYLQFYQQSTTGGFEYINSNANYALAQWNHLVVSHDISAGAPKLYYNGSERTVFSVGNWNTYYNNSDDQYQLNVGSDNSVNYYGRISILRIYKGKALSSTEVTQNYNAEKARYGY